MDTQSMESQRVRHDWVNNTFSQKMKIFTSLMTEGKGQHVHTGSREGMLLWENLHRT